MDNKNTIQFDPGYAPLIINTIGQVGYTYYTFSNISNIKIKKQSFSIVSLKLEKLLRINIAFYLGCLLWGCYISQFNDYKIEGNKLLNEECSKEEYTGELDFLIDFIENKYPRDYKYFKNKTYIADEKYIPILKCYREFLILNSGFTNCSKTNQIVLPDTLKKPSPEQFEKINYEIQNAIAQKDLTLLYECYSLIF